MLTQDFESIRLLPNESIDEFLNRFKSITNNLQSLEKVITCFEMSNKVLRPLPMEYNSIINPIEICKDINTLPFHELMWILKNAEIKMNIQKKRDLDDATQMKKKSIALKGTQDESSSEESTNEDDDLTYVIKKANKMMKKKFNKETSKDQMEEKMRPTP